MGTCKMQTWQHVGNLDGPLDVTGTSDAPSWVCYCLCSNHAPVMLTISLSVEAGNGEIGTYGDACGLQDSCVFAHDEGYHARRNAGQTDP